MEKTRLQLKYPLVVEGRYDKAALANFVSSAIITLDGFGIFNNTEKLALLRRVAGQGKVIILTDSDSAGMFIRRRLKSFIPADGMINIFAPAIPGRERRKTEDSADGILGVEGTPPDLLLDLLLPYADDGEPLPVHEPVTRQEFYADGFSGGPNSHELRSKLAIVLSLPTGMTAKALFEAVNMIIGREAYLRAKDEILGKNT